MCQEFGCAELSQHSESALEKAMLTLKYFQPRQAKRPRLERTMSLLPQKALGRSTRKTPS